MRYSDRDLQTMKHVMPRVFIAIPRVKNDVDSDTKEIFGPLHWILNQAAHSEAVCGFIRRNACQSKTRHESVDQKVRRSVVLRIGDYWPRRSPSKECTWAYLHSLPVQHGFLQYCPLLLPRNLNLIQSRYIVVMTLNWHRIDIKLKLIVDACRGNSPFFLLK